MVLRRISLLILAGLALQSCSRRAAPAHEKFVEFYVQLQMIDAQFGKRPAIQKQKVDSLMRAFNLNDSMVDSAIAWYGEKPDRWNKFFTDVEARVDTMKKDFVKPKVP